MNSTAYGGIFETEVVGTRTFTHALPDLLPPGLLLPWMPADGVYPVCPILKYRSGSRVQSLGDDSFWRQFRVDEATLAQRTKLDPTHKDMNTGDKLHALLQRMTPEDPKAADYWQRNLPTIKQCEAWIDRSTPDFKAAVKDAKVEPECLKLKDGTPIRTVWKFDGKGSLFSRVGWSGKASADHRPAEIRSLTEKYDRLELWLGYKHHAKDPKKSAWEYQTRRIPSKQALAHLKRLGLYWGRDRSKKAPIFMQPENIQKQPDKWLTLRDIVCPPLLPFSIRLKDCRLEELQATLDQSMFRKGDVLRLKLKTDGGVADHGEIVRWRDWYSVSAIMGDGKVEFKHVIYKSQPESPYAQSEGDVLTRKPSKTSVLAHQCGLPPAAELAVLLQLTPPPHDPPPIAPGGSPGPESGTGTSDFRLEQDSD